MHSRHTLLGTPKDPGWRGSGPRALAFAVGVVRLFAKNEVLAQSSDVLRHGGSAGGSPRSPRSFPDGRKEEAVTLEVGAAGL